MLIGNAYSLFSQMGFDPHKGENNYKQDIKKRIAELNQIDPNTIDCGIIMVKCTDEEKFRIVGGAFGNQLEIDTLEMLLAGEIDKLRLIGKDDKTTH